MSQQNGWQTTSWFGSVFDNFSPHRPLKRNFSEEKNIDVHMQPRQQLLWNLKYFFSLSPIEIFKSLKFHLNDDEVILVPN